jgi:hypothetical protein
MEMKKNHITLFAEGHKVNYICDFLQFSTKSGLKDSRYSWPSCSIVHGNNSSCLRYISNTRGTEH